MYIHWHTLTVNMKWTCNCNIDNHFTKIVSKQRESMFGEIECTNCKQLFSYQVDNDMIFVYGASGTYFRLEQKIPESLT